MSVTTQVPEMEHKSLYEVLRLGGWEDLDICDTIWDWGVNLGHGGYSSFEDIDKDNPMDPWYYKIILLFCLNIKVEKVQPKWYTVCHVAEFIDENREAFDKFMNEENREGYRPKDYPKHQNPTIDDELFYDIYLPTFESLVVGNYTDDDYKKLFEYLTK